MMLGTCYFSAEETPQSYFYNICDYKEELTQTENGLKDHWQEMKSEFLKYIFLKTVLVSFHRHRYRHTQW